jgi:hypothetical protein
MKKSIFLLAALLSSVSAYSANCDQKILKGTYEVTANGWIGPGSARVPFADVGLKKFHGDGTSTDLYSQVSVDGTVSPNLPPSTYTTSEISGAPHGVCQVSVTTYGLYHSSGVIKENGNRIELISTDPGTTLSYHYVRISDER